MRRDRQHSENALGEGDIDDLEWRDRCEYWRTYEPKRGKGRRPKYQYRQPIILNGHGVKIRVDHDTLLIRDGLTHYPQKPEEIRLFPGDANLPDRIFMVDGSGGITFDALDWMSEQQIGLVKLDWRGEITSMGGGAQYSANSNWRKFSGKQKSEKNQMNWLVGLLVKKYCRVAKLFGK